MWQQSGHTQGFSAACSRLTFATPMRAVQLSLVMNRADSTDPRSESHAGHIDIAT